jgi:flagellin-like hook-associated protein FlgL
VTEINNYLTANFSVTDREHLPTASYNNGDNFISFTASKAGEDFDITVGFDSSVDSISGTGTWRYTTNPSGLGDPSGTLSATKNISPFSVTKSISYFEEMLAQNEAETSRLMKAMEHLEDSMIHNEDALSKVQDTDYSQASVEHMRNAVKVQMANNVMGKSMRMNDLLIDLTTKHYRGSMLNAKA